MMKNIKTGVCIALLCSLGFVYARKGNIEENDYVPNAETAIKVAEAIWLPIYGEKIYKEKPFVATLDKSSGVWTVKGTLPPKFLGGVAYILIQKSDCKILKVYHEK